MAEGLQKKSSSLVFIGAVPCQLVLKLQVPDRSYIEGLFPTVDVAMQIAWQARERKLSVDELADGSLQCSMRVDHSLGSGKIIAFC